jgi:hypothetical protein
MPVTSLLSIVLLAASQLRMTSNAILFVAGAVVWTLSEYLVPVYIALFRAARTCVASCQPC